MTSLEKIRAQLAETPIVLPTETPDPGVGQVWRAFWDDVATNVYIEGAATPGRVVVLPVTAEADSARSVKFFLDRDESPVGYTAAVCRRPQVDLPVFVLDACYGSVPPMEEEPDDQPTELTGEALDADPGYQLEAAMTEQLDMLASARWMPSEQLAVGPIRSLVDRVGRNLRDLRRILGITADEISRLLDHAWWLTSDQRRRLADDLQVSVEDLPEGDPFADEPELVAVTEAPRQRRRLREYGRQRGLSEATARFQIARHLLAGARARSATPEADRVAYWEELLDDYLNG